MSKKKNKKKSVSYNSNTGEYKVIYGKEQYQKDESNFNNINSENIDKADWKGFQRLFIKDIVCNTKILQTESIGNYKLKDIETYLKQPASYWKQILGLSETLMRLSPHYMRLNNLFSNMALFQWWIDLYDISPNLNDNQAKQLKNKYYALSKQLEKMNIKHEFSKIMKVLPYQDIFCGLVIESRDDFFIQPVDYRICRLYQIQDGVYNFAIDLSKIKPQNIRAFPPEIQQEILFLYKNKDNGQKEAQSTWYLPEADKQICIKFNQQYPYPFPFMIGLLRDILDMDIYKKLKLQSARTDNYKAIMMKIPIDESTIDKPLITPDTLGIFADMNRESMTDDIGLIYTLGSPGEAISFKDSNNTRNNVADSNDDIYNSAGVTKELFNGSSSGTAVTFSVENDSGEISWE